MIEHSFGIIPFYKDNDGLKVFLIHQYGSGGDMLWTFPKGRQEPKETPLETAVRECREETGMELEAIMESHPLCTSYCFERNGERIEKTSTYYIGFVSGKEFVIQPEEVAEAGWFFVDVARERITFPDYKNLLDEAISLLDNFL